MNFTSEIRCIQCGKEFDADRAFSFAGNLACEMCVREHYAQENEIRKEYSPDMLYSPDAISEELRIRKLGAGRVLKQLEQRERRQEYRL